MTLAVAPALPLLGFVVLTFAGRRLSSVAVAAIGISSVAASFLALVAMLPSIPRAEVLGTWFSVAGLTSSFALRLDALSATWALLVTGVGTLVLLHAVDDLGEDPALARFYAHMDLFVAAMLALVLADDLLVLFLGWEGVGLCSWLLVGFWHQDPANARAARKAFVTTRVGDAAFTVGLLWLATALGTLSLPAVLAEGPVGLGEPGRWVVPLLLLGGAVGKSAQLPLHVWLPDAMAGPTPVSALLHAATMVTAGVYLLARAGPLFAAAPGVLVLVAWVGGATMLVGALAALGQTDLKRMLAYSTTSQIGLMFLALGAGAPSAAVSHFAAHGAFKALLFLSAGSVFLALHHDRDLTRMGGLRGALPGPFLGFLVGAAALAGLPFVTSGFASKEAAIASAAHVSWALWGLAIAGAFLTSLYAFRALFVAFFGDRPREPDRRPTGPARVAVVGLGALSIAGGGFALEADPLTTVAASAASLSGVATAWLTRRHLVAPRLLAAGFGVDRLYEAALVRPYVAAARWNRADRLGALADGVAAAAGAAHRALAATHTGRIRTSLLVVAVGAALLVVGLLGTVR